MGVIRHKIKSACQTEDGTAETSHKQTSKRGVEASGKLFCFCFLPAMPAAGPTIIRYQTKHSRFLVMPNGNPVSETLCRGVACPSLPRPLRNTRESARLLASARRALQRKEGGRSKTQNKKTKPSGHAHSSLLAKEKRKAKQGKKIAQQQSTYETHEPKPDNR